jgi:hypothetical protein
MSRGPRAEQIDGGDPTFRVEVETYSGRKIIVEDAQLLPHHEASKLARSLAGRVLGPGGAIRCVRVVSERTGFAKDVISYEPSHRLIESN